MTATTTTTGWAGMPARDRLRLALRFDAAATAAIGVVALAGARALDGPLGIPAAWLAGVGVFLLGWAALAAYGSGGGVRLGIAREIALGNLLWVAGSVAVAALAGLTALGVGVVLAQALAVAALAVFQLATVRRCS